MIKKVYIYDIEIFPNFFCAKFKHRDSDDWREFVLFNDRNDVIKLIEFLNNEVSGLIGFNNINYDYPILHYILNEKDITCEKLYTKSQELINTDFPSIRKPLIYQLDLYKIWHFDNKNKATSLKYIEAGIRFHNVEDLPFPYDYTVKEEDVQEILDYNLNDVNATEAFYNITIGKTDSELYKGDDKIQLRKDIQKEFGIDCLNYNNVKIGEEINKKYYLQATGKKWWDVKNSFTKRGWINVKDLIPDHISFKTPILREFLEEIRDKSFMPHQDFTREISFANCLFDFQKGGLHSQDSSKIIIPKEDEVLCDLDVASMYPAIIINEKIYPAHLGPEFLEVYKKVFDLRVASKKTNKSVAATLKLALNGGSFGKFGSEKSWMRDDLALYKVTFCGQLSLLMLIEELFWYDIKILSANTDGVVCIYKKRDKQLLSTIINQWQLKTGLTLEQTNYKKYIARDINNYITLKEDGKCKFKGCFEIDKELHKDPSQRIVAIALKEYFINNISVSDTIINHTDVFDFCCVDKKKGDAKLQSWTYDKSGNKEIQKLGKVVRYYVSNKGSQLMKILPPLAKNTITKTEIHKQKVDKAQINLFDFVEDVQVIKNREANLKKNQYCIVFNRYIKQDKYDINYEYYIEQAEKIIKQINKNYEIKNKS